MKTDVSNEDKRYNYNRKPEILDDFWNDCVEQKERKKNNTTKNNQKTRSNDLYHHHIQYNPSKGRNTNNNYNKKSNLRNYHSIKFFNRKYRANNYIKYSKQRGRRFSPSTEKFLIKLYNKYPSFVEEMKEQEDKKIKRQNALMRCLGLYAYGLELQKSMKISKENNERKREKDDISKCTFKPKLNRKISYLNNKINNNNNRLYQNNLKKFVNKSVDNLRKKENKNFDKEEYTFKPELITDPKAVERMFKNKRKQNKTITDENAEFILRYTKARDEYLIRRFKTMYRKDENYDYSFISLTKRLCNKQYRNYLNVNNTVFLYGETINNNDNLHSSIADFKGLSMYSEIPYQKNSKNQNYIIGLRKNLHSLDLNETDEH